MTTSLHPMPRMFAKQKSRFLKTDKRFTGLGLLALLVTAVMVLRSFLINAPSSATISAGNVDGLRHRLLVSIQRQMEWSHLQIEPVMTSGSIEMLERIEAGQLDFGLIQGGFDMSRYRDIRQVAVLGTEPLHLLLKEEIHDAATRDMKMLRGRTIEMGSNESSGTYWLSREVLGFVGLGPDDYRATHRPFHELREEKDRDRLPDALFVASPIPSELVEWLILEQRYRFLPMPFGESFRLRAFATGMPSPKGAIIVRKENISDSTIPTYAYRASPPIPDHPISTLGTRVLVVCHRRVSDVTVTRLLEAILASPHIKALHPTLDESIVRSLPELPWHTGAVAFRRRSEAFATGQSLAEMANTFTIAVPLFGTLFLFWKRFRSRLRADRDLSLDRLVDRVTKIELQALDLAMSTPDDLEKLRHLLRELAQIKIHALDRFSTEDLEERAIMGNFLIHVGDARTFLNYLQLLNLQLSRTQPQGEASTTAIPKVDENHSEM